jgi:hypothetical protein
MAEPMASRWSFQSRARTGWLRAAASVRCNNAQVRSGDLVATVLRQLEPCSPAAPLPPLPRWVRRVALFLPRVPRHLHVGFFPDLVQDSTVCVLPDGRAAGCIVGDPRPRAVCLDAGEFSYPLRVAFTAKPSRAATHTVTSLAHGLFMASAPDDAVVLAVQDADNNAAFYLLNDDGDGGLVQRAGMRLCGTARMRAMCATRDGVLALHAREDLDAESRVTVARWAAPNCERATQWRVHASAVAAGWRPRALAALGEGRAVVAGYSAAPPHAPTLLFVDAATGDLHDAVATRVDFPSCVAVNTRGEVLVGGSGEAQLDGCYLAVHTHTGAAVYALVYGTLACVHSISAAVARGVDFYVFCGRCLAWRSVVVP